MKSIFKMLLSGLLGLAVIGAVMFVAAGTFNYWQAWVVLAIWVISSWIMSIYFLRTDPAVLQRRQLTSESRPVQKVLIGGAVLCVAGMIVLSALDHRFGWSVVPTAISLVGAVLFAVAFNGFTLVLAQNSHAAFTVRVEESQPLISTGLYGLVRHPMYTCNTLVMVGIPLALGSYWGLVFIIPIFLLFALRIRDEEKLLQEELGGYREYMQKVPSRVVPGIW
jgi:protein-S-isoprenylcysteine O-methyltransferase Ste14